MFNANTSQNKTKKHTLHFDATHQIDTPKMYTVKKTAIFGMFSLLSILMLNVPTMLANTYVYGEDFENDLNMSDETSLVRNHFISGSAVHPNLVIDKDSHGSLPLEERTDLKKHFSYGKIVSNPSYEASWLNFHEERR